MASATPRAGPPAAGACDPGFLEWCRAGGVRVDGVAPAFVADGWRGVVATRAIGPGDVLVATPAPLLLTGRSARRDAALGPLLRQPQHAGLSDHQASEAGCFSGWGPVFVTRVQLVLAAGRARAARSAPHSSPQRRRCGPQVLAAHLLHEASKGPASAWHLYISQLPRSYTTLCCFPAAAAEALQLSHAVQAARDAEAKAKADWRGSWPLLQDLGEGAPAPHHGRLPSTPCSPCALVAPTQARNTRIPSAVSMRSPPHSHCRAGQEVVLLGRLAVGRIHRAVAHHVSWHHTRA